MNSSANNLVHIDDSIKSMHEFIIAHGEEPVEADACNGRAYTNNKFGELGEQYVRCLFKEAGITKLVGGEKPSPDFEVLINDEKFLLEVKAVSNLYKNLYQLLYETAEEENNQTFFDKAEILRNTHNFDINPAEIHREDQREFKEKLRRIIKEIGLPLHNKTAFQIRCKIRTYALSLRPAGDAVKGVHSVTGWLPEETRTLDNIIFNKRLQIGSSDIMVIILLNKTIGQDDLFYFFYRAIGIIISEDFSIRPISQYQYEQTIWGQEFEDERGQLHAIGERLKCAIVIFPFSKAALIFPSIKHFENFGASEYFCLRALLERKGFKCCWATHEVNLIR